MTRESRFENRPRLKDGNHGNKECTVGLHSRRWERAQKAEWTAGGLAGLTEKKGMGKGQGRRWKSQFFSVLFVAEPGGRVPIVAL